MKRQDAIHPTRPLTRDNLKHALLAAHAFNQDSRHQGFDLEELCLAFETRDQDQRTTERQLIDFLDELARQGAIQWQVAPEERALQRARATLDHCYYAEIECMWRNLRLPPLALEENLQKLRSHRIFGENLGVFDRELTFRPNEAPPTWLSFHLSVQPVLDTEPARLAPHVPSIGWSEVAKAIETAGGSATFDQIADWFSLRGEARNQLATLLSRWVDEGSFAAEGKAGKERYSEEPAPLQTNAATLYLQLWPYTDSPRRSPPSRDPIGTNEAARRTNLAKATVSEHFALLAKANLVSKTQDGKFALAMPHAVLRLTRLVAELRSKREAGDALSIGEVLDRMASHVNGEPWYVLRKSGVHLSFMEAAHKAGLIRIRIPSGGSLRDPAAQVDIEPEVWITLHACPKCGGPWGQAELVLFDEPKPNFSAQWVRIAHAKCPPRSDWNWELEPAEPSVYDVENVRGHLHCKDCEGYLWPYYPPDFTGDIHSTGIGGLAMGRLQRLRTLVRGAGALLPEAEPRERFRVLLDQLQLEGLEWKKRAAILARLEHALRTTNLEVTHERRAWIDAILTLEARYFQHEDELLSHGGRLIRPEQEHVQIEEMRGKRRREPPSKPHATTSKKASGA